MYPVWSDDEVSPTTESGVDIRKEEVKMCCNKTSCFDKCCTSAGLNESHGEHDKGQELDREGGDEEADFFTTVLESGPVICEG